MVVDPEDCEDWLCCPGEEKLCVAGGWATGGGCWAAWFFGVVWGDCEQEMRSCNHQWGHVTYLKKK